MKSRIFRIHVKVFVKIQEIVKYIIFKDYCKKNKKLKN